MNLNEENVDFGVKPTKGRRANNSQSSAELVNVDQIPVVSKKSGWADETLKSAKNKSSVNLIEQQRFHEQRVDWDDNIPVVPDIEEIHDEGFETDVARAPTSSTSQSNSSTYKELLSGGPLAQLGDLDLTFLIRFMYGREQVRQPDDTWTRDALFQQLVTNSNS